MAGESVRINVSEDKLDSKLAALELRLVDRITAALESKADAVVVEAVRLRLHNVEGTAATIGPILQQVTDQEQRLRGLERFRYAIPSVSVLGLLVSVAVAAFTLMH